MNEKALKTLEYSKIIQMLENFLHIFLWKRFVPKSYPFDNLK